MQSSAMKQMMKIFDTLLVGIYDNWWRIYSANL